ncbi:TrmH family RNA methyltransferase [Solemya velesiana gill symbiont]|uniref:tRNA (Guanine-N2)-dimethyltransferase n=1 Tax=Solemya velesiana gill symbiont TaxID=1918948 RepID=A0A1T2KYD1_9GAMM|nr:TrmH family RNA methyltransferase [Solemya velesiana gill symbiont]OOZ37869.1 tRNA (guanine-N2)-dimethyltransferase [Solemya velesiana gill symbiont]
MPLRKSKKFDRNQALRRYEKNRRRNLLAEPGEHNFAIVLDHLKAGFNVPKIFRSAGAFGAAEVHLVNIGPFDPAPAKGAFKTVPARFHETFETCYQALISDGYTLYTLEADKGEMLHQVAFPEECAFIFGHEERGLSFDPEDYPEIRKLTIPQYGQIESLNVSVAASIVMYEYIRQHGGEPRKSVPKNEPRRVMDR